MQRAVSLVGLLGGLSGVCSSSSSPLNAAVAANVVHTQLSSQAAQTGLPAPRQPFSCRSFSCLQAAAAAVHQQHSGLGQPQASPLQQLQRLPLPLWQQHCQPFPQQQQQQCPQVQQARSFVLMPRRVKYRKAHKSMGFNETICGNTRQLAFGLYGIRALEHCRIPASTLEAVRRTLRRTIKKSAMLWIRATPNVPVTSKPAEVRMGKGKGTLDYWAAPIRPGQIIFEMDRCSKATAMQAVAAIKAKMPIKVDFVEWN